MKLLKSKVGISVSCLPGVDAATRAEVRRVVKGFAKVSSVRHRIQITVMPHPLVRADRGNAWGWVMYPLKKRSLPHMVLIAGRVPKRDGRRSWVRGGYGRNGSARCVGQTILHELTHYEQWRDGREVTERGVNVRATGLYRQIDRLGA